MFKQTYSLVILFLLLFGVILSAGEKAEKVNAEFGKFGVLSISTVATLKDSSRSQEFEIWVNEAMVKVNKVFPGLKWLVLKADRGEVKGNYVSIFLYDSVERRNFYYPPGEGMSEAGQKLWDDNNIQAVADKFGEFVNYRWKSDFIFMK